MGDHVTARCWSAGDGRLDPAPDLALARTTVAGYRAEDEAQARERDRILEFIDRHPDALHRSCLTGHLTASSLILDARGERALLTHHRKLRRWLQLGGHCDGDANLAGVAWREATEESGIGGLSIDPRPVDLDVHPIPARPGEPRHLHLDVRFIVHAPDGATESASEESLELGWFRPGELSAIDTDDSVHRLFRIAFGASSA